MDPTRRAERSDFNLKNSAQRPQSLDGPISLRRHAQVGKFECWNNTPLDAFQVARLA